MKKYIVACGTSNGPIGYYGYLRRKGDGWALTESADDAELFLCLADAHVDLADIALEVDGRTVRRSDLFAIEVDAAAADKRRVLHDLFRDVSAVHSRASWAAYRYHGEDGSVLLDEAARELDEAAVTLAALADSAETACRRWADEVNGSLVDEAEHLPL